MLLVNASLPSGHCIFDRAFIFARKPWLKAASVLSHECVAALSRQNRLGRMNEAISVNLGGLRAMGLVRRVFGPYGYC